MEEAGAAASSPFPSPLLSGVGRKVVPACICAFKARRCNSSLSSALLSSALQVPSTHIGLVGSFSLH